MLVFGLVLLWVSSGQAQAQTAEVVLPAGTQTMTEGVGSKDRTLRYPVSLSKTPELGDTEEVTVTVSMSSTGIVTVDTDEDTDGYQDDPLIFTKADQLHTINNTKYVWLTVVEDDDAKDEEVVLTHTATSSKGSGDFHNIEAMLTVTVEDDETAGFVFNPPTLTMYENSQTKTYGVKLSSPPTAPPVTVDVESSAPIVMVDQSSLTFTAQNWNQSQDIEVTSSSDENAADDLVTVTHTISSPGGDQYEEYEGVSGMVMVRVEDAELPGLVVDHEMLEVDEGDLTGADFNVELSTLPTGDVVVTATFPNGDADKVMLNCSGRPFTTVNCSSLVFTPDNWNVPQRVTVTGVQDIDAHSETVRLNLAASGGGYNGVIRVLTVTVDDDDAFLVLSPPGMTVTEGGGTGVTYTVKLADEPSGSVPVMVEGADGTDLTVRPNSLTFTTANWDTPQEVTVTAGHDSDGDNDSVDLIHRVTGGIHQGRTARLTVTVEDDENTSLVLSPISVRVPEGDETGATYTVRLPTKPSEDVTVVVRGATGTSLNVRPERLRFTPMNWNTAQRVRVRAEEDEGTEDENLNLEHVASTDDYTDKILSVVVEDNDLKRIIISPPPLLVREEDQTGEIYGVRLSAEPSSPVTVNVTVEGASEVSVTPESLLFAEDNWDMTQTVTVKAADDVDHDDEQVTLRYTASDQEYADVTTTLTVEDNDPGLVLDHSVIRVTEGDPAGASYTVRFSNQTADSVTVFIRGFGDTGITVDPPSLTFATEDWDQPQRITVTAVEDEDAQDLSGATAVKLRHVSSNPNHEEKSLSVIVKDNDENGLVLSRSSVRLNEGDRTTYTVVLQSQPSENVTVSVSGDDTGAVTVDPANLTFTRDNWDTAQTVTVRGIEDDDATDERVTVTHIAQGQGYEADRPTLTVTVDDNDPGLVFNPPSLTVSEETQPTATYTVALEEQPTGNVNVMVSSDAPDVFLEADPRLTASESLLTAEASPVLPSTFRTTKVNGMGLTFTRGAWNVPQRIKVMVTDDQEADGTVLLNHVVNNGEGDLISQTLRLEINDNDPGLVFEPSSVTVTEGITAIYRVRLSMQPSDNMTVSVSSADTDVATVDPASLTFTTENWNVPQIVMVEGEQDTDTMNETVTLNHEPDNATYPAKALAVTVQDDDVQIELTPSTVTVTEGDQKGVPYTVRLLTMPIGDVTVTVASEDPDVVVVDPASLTFTTANWNVAQTVTVTADEDDNIADDTVTVTHEASGGGLDNASESMRVTVRDNDKPGLVLTPAELPLQVREGAEAEYTVALTARPSGNVTVTVAGIEETDVTVDKETLTFTSDSWGTAQTVTVTAAQDDDDEDDAVEISHTAGGGGFDDNVTATLMVKVADNDGVSVPKAWLARFGRTVASQLVDAVGDRLTESPESQVTIGGHQLPVGGGIMALAGSGNVTGSSPFGSGAAGDSWSDGREVFGQGRRSSGNLDLRDLLLRSSFRFVFDEDDDDSMDWRLSAWGRAVGTQFEGEDSTLSLDGSVITGILGVDAEWDSWLAGMAISHSRGSGTFHGLSATRRGKLDNDLTTVLPYLRYRIHDRLSLWSLMGYGWGTLSVNAIETDETQTDMLMTAFGGRGVLLPVENFGGYELATRSDMFMTWSSADEVAGFDSAKASAHRLRFLLEGSTNFTWPGSQRLTPLVQLGTRYDMGDAETGVGLELGGQVRYADPWMGLTVEAAARGMLLHQKNDYKEWGAWGTVRVDPGTEAQGLALSVSPSWGVASSGLDSLWAQQTVSGLGVSNARVSGGLGAQALRLNVQAGYGMWMPSVGGLVTPFTGMEVSGQGLSRSRVGLTLDRLRTRAGDLGLELAGEHLETAQGQPEQRIGLQVRLQFGGGSRLPVDKGRETSVPASAERVTSTQAAFVPPVRGSALRTRSRRFASLAGKHRGEGKQVGAAKAAPTVSRRHAVSVGAGNRTGVRRYFVQLGAFSRPANAMRARTVLAGKLSRILSRPKLGLTVLRLKPGGFLRVVFAHAFRTRRVASALCAGIQARGVDCYVMSTRVGFGRNVRGRWVTEARRGG